MKTAAIQCSVCICAHNPRTEYLTRVLAALQTQTLPFEKWELLLIDNASNSILSAEWDLSWHPQARHIREEELGLTPARLRAITEAKSELLIFVDDDNVLERDYLETAVELSSIWPMLGAWGANIKGEFEREPELWVKPFLRYLAINELESDSWSNDPEHRQAYPCGAGLCVRREVASAYAAECELNPIKRLLDRRGASLSSGGDNDLVWTTTSLQLGFGKFRDLRLTHLIPAVRVEEAYLLNLIKSMATSGQLFNFIHQGEVVPPGGIVRTILRHWFSLLTLRGRNRRFYLAAVAGDQEATELIKTLKLSTAKEHRSDGIGIFESAGKAK